MKYLLGITISYLILYIVIYLHEVGHAIFYYKYQCKDNPFHVTVKPYLFFSTPAPVDESKLSLLSKKENLFVAYGGLLVNMIFALITYFLSLNIDTSNFYISLILYQFITLHLAEVVSYMVIGNIYLVSDMAEIFRNEKRLRWPNLIIGLIITVFYLYVFTLIPKTILPLIIIFNLLTILAMGVGRVVFTVRSKMINNHN